MSPSESLVRQALAAQASYAFLDSGATVQALNQAGAADMPSAAAQRFLGIVGAPGNGLTLVNHTPNGPTGFSASLFRDKTTGGAILAIRGTDEIIVDHAQDLKLALVGFANDQLISLYRYYRQLTTPGGATVQYSPEEIGLLHRLNTAGVSLISGPALLVPRLVAAFKSNSILDSLLAQDKGIVAEGSTESVLQPGEQLTVTGHSLGGHLAVLFGRLFPDVTQAIYAFNAPGIASWGERALDSFGLAPSNPSHIFNVVSDYGPSVVAAYGERPGATAHVFIEGGAASQNHSIVPLSDSLVLYDVFAKLSPGLADRFDEISSLLAGASRKPGDSLERSLDSLRRLVGVNESPTPIALTAADQANRDVYYSRIYDLGDNHADRDWRISSLVGSNAATLTFHSLFDPAYRYALTELNPFVASGADIDPALLSLSSRWIDARSDFLSRLLEARASDQPFALSHTKENYLYADVDKGETLAVLNPASAIVGFNQESDQALSSYLDSLAYQRKVIFGSNDAAHPDDIDGTDGADVLFGNAGDDQLKGGAGDDVLIGGTGDNVLEGGLGFDLYSYEGELKQDTIRDADGKGTVEISDPASPFGAASSLVGGELGADGQYHDGEGHTYALSGDVLTIDDALTIEGFHDGDLGIRLIRVPELERTRPASTATYTGDFEVSYFTEPHIDDLGNLRSGRGGISAPGQPDVFHGEPGNILFVTLDGPDYVNADQGGDDTLLLGRGMDFGYGGAGNDWIEGGPDADALLGGPGDDVLIGESLDTDIDIPVGTLEFYTDSSAWPASYQLLSAGDGDDIVRGSGSSDLIEGGAGADLLIGGAGSDAIEGDGIAGAVAPLRDPVRIFDGEPIFSLRPDSGTYFRFTSAYDLGPDAAEGGNDRIYAGAGSDVVDGGPGDDLVYGGPGGDSLYGGSGRDRLYGEDGNDTLYGDGGTGRPGALFDTRPDDGADELFGDAGNDNIFGGGGDDRIDGGTGDDRLFGGDGDDLLIGSVGNDLLGGGAGADTLDGGPGSDTYMVGDSDRVILRLGETSLDVIEADGAFPTSATIVLGDEFDPTELAFLTLDAQSSMLDVGDGAPIVLFGSAADWAGLKFQFADGETLALSDLPQRAGTLGDLGFDSFLFGPPDAGFFSGNGVRTRLAGGSGDDTYQFQAGDGRDSIDDSAGFDTLMFANVDADHVQVVKSSNDYLLRYPGGELRLVGQANADTGIDFVVFGASAAWTRDDLDSHAIEAPPTNEGPLEVQLATEGQSFTFALPDEAFAGQYLLGDPSYVATDLQGDALPAWLHFDADHLTLSGTPGAADVGLTTVAFDLIDGTDVLAVAPLVINVEAAPPPPPPPPPVEPPPSTEPPPGVEPPPPQSDAPPAENAGPPTEIPPASEEPPQDQPPVAGVEEPPPSTPPADASPPPVTDAQPPVDETPPSEIAGPPPSDTPPASEEPPQDQPPVAGVEEPPPSTPPVDVSPPPVSDAQPPADETPPTETAGPPPSETPPAPSEPPPQPPVAVIEEPPVTTPPVDAAPPVAEIPPMPEEPPAAPPVSVVEDPPPPAPPVEAAPPVVAEAPPPASAPPTESAGGNEPPAAVVASDTQPPTETPTAESAATNDVELEVASAVRVTAITAQQAGAILAERRSVRATTLASEEATAVDAQTAVPTVPTTRSETSVPPVGGIADPGYRQIESLLFSPAATHAPRFMERYAESIREFRERHTTVPERQTAPLPSDEEMGAYNAALHAWLDRDAERRSAFDDWRGVDAGGVTANWFAAGDGFERLLASTTDAFARPGLRALQSIQARPGLDEGLSKLGG